MSTEQCISAETTCGGELNLKSTISTREVEAAGSREELLMKKASIIASVLLLGAGASHAGAQVAGSDTLFEVSTDIFAACGESPALTYVGGGSGTGENALVAGTQELAPMSRPLLCTVTAAAAAPFSVHIADDAIGIWRSTPGGGDVCTDTTRDILRQVYFGVGTAGNGTGGTQDCGNATRRGIIANWAQVFGQAACGAGTCTTLRHAYRRNDLSGTTDIFRSRLGISTSLSVATTGVPVVPFCNGNDGNATNNLGGQIQADNDPIRTACGADDDVCGPTQPNANGFPNRTLGVVLSVFIPQALQGGSTLTDLYAPQACQSGKYVYFPNARIPNTGPCQSGAPSLAGLCLTPATASGQGNCLVGLQTNPVGSAATFDSRNFNLVLRNAAGAVRLTSPSAPATAQRVTTAYYRHNANSVGTICNTQTDDTDLIGCFTRDACSIGYAGFAAGQAGGVAASTVGGQQPLPGGVPNENYLFFRKLYINGLRNLTPGSNWDTLRNCFADRPNIDNVVAARGFFKAADNSPTDPIPVLTGAAVPCQ
jgi:ABC-type phosphate transport system substrate-binding protein